MKKVGKFLLCFVPVICMLAINVGVSIICTIVEEVKYIAANGTGDMATMQEWLLALATDKDFLLKTTLIFQACLVIVAALVYFFAFKEKQIGNPVKLLGGMGIVSVIFIFCGVELLVGCGLQLASVLFPETMKNYAEMMERSGLGELSTLSTICTLVMAPIGEELVFRGMTFKLARKFSKNFWIANIIQALMFGIAHMNIVQGTYAFILGILLGYFYKKFNSLWATMIAHLTFNFCGTYLVRPVFGDETSTVRYIIVALVSAIVIVLGFFALSKTKTVEIQEALFVERYEAERAPKAVPVSAAVGTVSQEAAQANSAVEENAEF